MSIASTLKNALLPDNDDAQDDKVAVAFQKTLDATKLIANWSQKAERNASTVNKLRAERGEAALETDTPAGRAAFDKIEAALLLAQKELAISESALSTAQARSVDAEAALLVARGADDVRLVTRLTRHRSKYVALHVSAIAEYTKTFDQLLKATERLAMGFPRQPAPVGAYLDPVSIQELIGLELARQRPIDSLDATPKTPGSIFSSFTNPHAEVSMVEKCQIADQHLIALISKVPK
jgi:hypothetical protein